MGHKQSGSLTGTAFNFGRKQIEDEMGLRLALPLDAWDHVGTGESVSSGARAHLAHLAKIGNGDAT